MPLSSSNEEVFGLKFSLHSMLFSFLGGSALFQPSILKIRLLLVCGVCLVCAHVSFVLLFELWLGFFFAVKKKFCDSGFSMYLVLRFFLMCLLVLCSSVVNEYDLLGFIFFLLLLL